MTATTVPASMASRYELLDVFRGLAALSVVAFLSVNSFIAQEQSPVADVLWHGWIGYLFFPISGFCILAASHSRANTHVGDFLRRRWKRIFPTYGASIAFVVAVTLLFAPFSRGSARTLLEPGLGWLSILTLTQTFTGLSGAINPVYWSLCYEEQFYLLIALTMLTSERQRPALLIAISLFAAVGLAVFGWTNPRYGRRWNSAIFALAALTLLSTGNSDLAISIGLAVLLVALRPWDRLLATSHLFAPFGAIGLFLYSLYLTHVPIAGRIVNLAKRFGVEATPWWPLVIVVTMATSIAIAWMFYRLVEQHFLNSRRALSSVIRMPKPALMIEV